MSITPHVVGGKRVVEKYKYKCQQRDCQFHSWARQTRFVVRLFIRWEWK